MLKKVLFILSMLISLHSIATPTDTVMLSTDSIGKKKLSSFNFKRSVKLSLPVVLIGYGFTSLDNQLVKRADKHIRHELLEEYPRFSTHLDDKLQYSPMVAVYALNFMGVKGKNDFVDRTALYLISNSIMSLSVNFLKKETGKLRPSGQDRRSFPSGHTATAFVAAEYMRQEFQDVSPWYGYIGYSLATTTGALRMMSNHHWFSDVLAGAGVGILSTKLTYVAYPWIKRKIIKNKELNFVAAPAIQNGRVGFSAIIPL